MDERDRGVSRGAPGEILRTLSRHDVDFIVIGGLAAIAHGSRRVTRDIDIVIRPDSENLARLEQALRALAAVQLVTGGVEHPIEAADVAMVGLGTTLHTRSAAGRLDVVGAPAGAASYEDLVGRAIAAPVLGVPTAIAGLDDLLAMKRASGRPLDLQDIADLTAQPPDR